MCLPMTAPRGNQFVLGSHAIYPVLVYGVVKAESDPLPRRFCNHTYLAFTTCQGFMWLLCVSSLALVVRLLTLRIFSVAQ